VLGCLHGQPVAGPHPPVQRGPLGSWQPQRRQPVRVDQRQPGQSIGVDTVGLRVPGQEPAQVGRLLAGHSKHGMAPGAEEHRDRQPRRPGGLHHHLQPGALGCADQGRLFDQRQTRNARFAAAPAHLPPRAVQDPNRMRGRDTQVDSHQPSLPVHRSPIAETSPHRSSWPRRAANTTATVPRRQSPTTAPTHVLQTGPTSPGRPTSLIRDIRGQASGGNQLHEALPQRTTQRHPPDQPGCSCNPGTPSRPSAGVLYMRTCQPARIAANAGRQWACPEWPPMRPRTSRCAAPAGLDGGENAVPVQQRGG
jgi:hypothetical protein